MHITAWIALTLVIAAAGGAFFKLLGIPMPWLLGALAATMLASRPLPGVRVPVIIRDVLQPVLGVSLGSYFAPSLLDRFDQWPEVFLGLALYVIVSGSLGFAYFRRFAGYDAKTAFVCAVPGGFNELVVVGGALGANVVLVGLTHATRVLFVVMTMPFIVTYLVGPLARPSPPAAVPLGLDDFLILLACGTIGYALGRWGRLPAGSFLGPLLLSAGMHMAGLTHSSPPAPLISVVQIVIGAYVGARFAGLRWRQFGSAVIHGVVWTSLLTCLALAFAGICAKLTGFGLVQLILAFAPGGVAEMGLLTLALGIDVALVTTCHVARILMAFTVIPFMSRRGADIAPLP